MNVEREDKKINLAISLALFVTQKVRASRFAIFHNS